MLITTLLPLLISNTTTPRRRCCCTKVEWVDKNKRRATVAAATAATASTATTATTLYKESDRKQEKADGRANLSKPVEPAFEGA